MFDKNFNDKGYFEQRNRAKQRISDYKAEMKDYQNDLERVRQEFDSLGTIIWHGKKFMVKFILC